MGIGQGFFGRLFCPYNAPSSVGVRWGLGVRFLESLLDKTEATWMPAITVARAASDRTCVFLVGVLFLKLFKP